MKRIWGFILATLAIIGTYIGVNQLTNRKGISQPEPPETEEYGLGMPKSGGTGAGTRNTNKVQ
jgi:hypothetical protein